MRFENLFESVAIKTDYMNNILSKTIQLIGKSLDFDDLSFGPLCEGPTISDEAGDVSEDGYIRLDSNKLQGYDDEVAMAIVAHELAHYHLKHFENFENSLENEYEADNLARTWGLEIDKFRSICGPPTVQSQR